MPGARKTIDSFILLGRAYDFTVTEYPIDDDGEVRVDFEGHGELVEMRFLRTASEYLTFKEAFLHLDTGAADRLRTRRAAEDELRSIAEHAESQQPHF